MLMTQLVQWAHLGQVFNHNYVKRVAPDSDYQGCCLHSLNFAVCKASSITSIKNMFDSCQQAFLFLPKDSDS